MSATVREHNLPVIVHRTHRVEGDEVQESVLECDHPDCRWRFPLDPYHEGIVAEAVAAYNEAHSLLDEETS